MPTFGQSKTNLFFMLLISLLSLSPESLSVYAYVTRIEQCEPIEIPRCQAMPYNMTQMPNLVHHNTQQNARLVFQRFEELIDRRCSDVLLFLLCAIYVPICPVSLLQREAIPPCRDVCERAKQGCEPVMNRYNVSWNDAFFDCARLPWYERGVCVIPEAIVQKSDKPELPKKPLVEDTVIVPPQRKGECLKLPCCHATPLTIIIRFPNIEPRRR
ncbi:secreted frizzled-related protein 3-like [Plakobranchus ocellatus]|uniref:Secreted frizzled-related protein 3-like n=1 Tax=Plakobranchus ocellatus TaxID=259542 RepID=A0AAV4A5F2_9GAST|nr:secreted frizzled-related protein 3-like [Plakobranchus ocellatus]